jgi:hypothetical protein
MNPAEYMLHFLMELERLMPGRGTRHMISTTTNGQLEIRIGSGDRYRVSDGVIDDPDPVRAARKIAAAPAHWGI